MNGDIKIWDIRQSDIPISSTNAFANGLSSMAIHSHCPVFAATSAPYASSSYNDGRNSHGSGQNGVRRGQRLNVYRMDDDTTRGYESNSYGFDSGGKSSQSSSRGGVRADKYSGLPNNSGDKQSQSYSNRPDADTDGPQPNLLSSVMIRGDGGHVSAPSTPSISGLPGDYDTDKRQGRATTASAQSQPKRRWGAGMNALAFHPVSCHPHLERLYRN